jgi:DNA-binding IclR family transcriptional regulator
MTHAPNAYDPAMPARAPASPPPAPPAKKPVRVRPVPAVTRSIAILRLLGDTGRPLGVKAIADALDLVPSTALHILRVLVAEGLVRVDPDSKRYELGAGMLSLARSVLATTSFAQLAQPGLDRIAARGVTAMLVEITPRQDIVVLGVARPNQPFRLHTEVGSRFAFWASATGRLVAAHSGEKGAALKARFQAIGWDKPMTFDEWQKDVEQARRRGWAVDRDHFMAGVTVVAVPLLRPDGRLTHTIAAAGLSSQLTGPVVQDLAAAMRAEAAALNEILLLKV